MQHSVWCESLVWIEGKLSLVEYQGSEQPFNLQSRYVSLVRTEA